MPNFDGTGPQCEGSKTGFQMGKCKGATSSGRRGGCGRTRGFRNREKIMTKTEEKSLLKKEKEFIEKRLRELE
ncbi:DUF5320 domain-containing protein [archaeon]|jgi:hypothetical protein|nr:DUF5320 domain-containing protein [archaeon]MBT4396692.1 DUF5320 domain-containing protein [archaeon]MBT4441302.1 DUF5320 domain-containing protein [archaeon]